MEQNHIDQFESWLRALVPADGSVRKFGNVEVWIDTTGPWAGQLSYSISNSQWDIPAISADLASGLQALQGESSRRSETSTLKNI